MGFTLPKTIYVLDFEGTELEGAEVKMSGSKLGAAFEAVGAAHLVGIEYGEATVEDVKAALSQYEELAKYLISWNLTDEDGNAVPANLEGLKALEVRHVNMITAAWQRAQVDVPHPVPSASSPGPLPDLPMIPMSGIPESLAS